MKKFERNRSGNALGPEQMLSSFPKKFVSVTDQEMRSVQNNGPSTVPIVLERNRSGNALGNPGFHYSP